MAAQALGAGAMMATLMACYGMPIEDCSKNGCSTGLVCSSTGECVPEICDNGIDDDNNGLVDDADPYCTPETCGDATLTPDTDEQCDDGNETDGDGCSATCQLELGQYCLGVPELTLGTVTFDLADGTNGFSSSCVGDGGPEIVLMFTPPQAGSLTISATGETSDVGLYALDSCDATAPAELGCVGTSTQPAELVLTGLVANEPVYIVADTADVAASGLVTLDSSFTAN
ncbi:MAG: hypothetical protein U0271_21545 [Polyangiaceae bacterium]